LPPGEYRLTAKPGAVTDRVGNELVTAFQHWVVGGTTPPPVTNNNSVFNLSSGALTLSGSSDDDVIVVAKFAGDVSKVLVSVNGVRHIYSRSQISSILVQAGSGDDMVNLDGVSISSKVLAGAGNDTVYGSQAADRISGGDGNDWINAGAGNDTLYGDAGDDKLFGGEGKDYVSGGGGANVLRGGDGVDRILGTKSIDDYRTNRGDIIKLVLV
jgi:Ca2+-binding RTX toxin-like protein